MNGVVTSAKVNAECYLPCAWSLAFLRRFVRTRLPQITIPSKTTATPPAISLFFDF